MTRSVQFLAYSDFHFRPEVAAAEGVPERLVFQMRTARWIGEMVIKYQPQAVVNLGDTNHSHGHVPVESVPAMCESINHIGLTCAELEIPHIVMAGNHDQADRSGEHTVLPAITIPSDTEVTGTYYNANLDAAFIAHHWEPKDFREAVADALGAAAVGRRGSEPLHHLFMHQDLAGAMWTPQAPPSTGHDPETVESFDRVICGHYHHPQQLRNITVVGSPCYLDWTDHWIAGAPRGVILVHNKRTGPKRLKPHFIERIANPHTPIRHTLKVEKSREAIEWLKEFRGEAPAGSPLLLRVKCPSEKIAENVRIKAGRKRLDLLKALQVSSTRGAKYRSVDLGFTAQAESPEQALRAFVEGETHDLDPELLVAAGLEALGGKR